MTNALKGEVPLKLNDGTHLTLVFDMEAMIEAEGAYGKPMLTMVGDASVGFIGAIRAMLYGALRAHHSDLSLKDVSEMLRENTEVITDALAKAHDAAMPASNGVSAEGKAAPRRRPGKISGANGAKRGSPRKPSGG